MSARTASRSTVPAFACAGLVLALAVTPAQAQSSANTGLAGRVTDSSGASIPGVTVRLTQVETGAERTVTTGSTGDWEARFLSPGTYSMNLSKLTNLGNGRSIEFRIEAYNVTNTPTFRNPNRDISSPDFGKITRTRGGPRVIQLGVKLKF